MRADRVPEAIAVATCSSCGTDNEPGARFCVECATPLVAALPRVRHRQPAGRQVLRPRARPRWCRGPACAGGATRPPPALARPGAAAGLVLFADLVGFTPFAEERDAEEVRETLTRYFDLASEVIGRYGGTVEKFIGDAVMAVWGAPTAREDDAERAVRAALELVDAVRAARSRRSRRAPACSPARRPSRSAPPTRAWSRATSSTPRPGSSRWRCPGTVLVGEATHARRRGRDRVRAGRRPDAQGEGGARCRPGGPCGSSPERGGRDRVGRPRGARSSVATTSSAC